MSKSSNLRFLNHVLKQKRRFNFLTNQETNKNVILYASRLFSSDVFNKTDSKNNIDLGKKNLTQGHELKAFNQDNEILKSSSGIDVDEEMQRFSYEEFVEIVEEKKPKLKENFDHLKRGVQGVFDPEELEQFLISEKMMDVFVVSIPKEKNFCSCMVIASAKNFRQLNAVAEKIRVMYKRKREEGDDESLTLEGSTSDWVAIDLGNIVLHLMLHEIREKYKLEKLWTDEDIEEGEELVEEFSFEEELRKVRELREHMDGSIVK